MKLYNEIGSIHDFKEDQFFSNEKLCELIAKKNNIFLNNNINKGDNVIVAHGNNHLFFCDH